MNVIETLNLLMMTTMNVAPALLPLVIKDEADRAQAELYLGLLRKGMEKIQGEMAEVMAGIADPSTINLDELFEQNFDAVVAKLKAERGEG